MIRGEIWRAEFGIPYGSEIGFTRPVLIVQDDGFNESKIKGIIPQIRFLVFLKP